SDVDMWTSVCPHDNRRSGRILAMWTSTLGIGGGGARYRDASPSHCQNNYLLVTSTKRIGTGRFSFHPLVNLSYLLSREIICRAIDVDNTPPHPDVDVHTTKTAPDLQKRRGQTDVHMSTCPRRRPPPRSTRSPGPRTTAGSPTSSMTTADCCTCNRHPGPHKNRKHP